MSKMTINIFLVLVYITTVRCQSTYDENGGLRYHCCSCHEDYGLSSKTKTYIDCSHAKREGQTKSGIYLIKPNDVNIENLPSDQMTPFYVYCDMDTDGGGWLVFQRRKDGSIDFYRTWKDYRDGFGKLTGEMWLGNEKLFHITTGRSYTLRVDLEDFENNKVYALYTDFIIDSERTNYKLHIGNYSGNAGDALGYHNLREFSTKDEDNDMHRTNCAQQYKGAWWYGTCHDSNLNGQYLNGSHSSYANGVNWEFFKGDYYSLKFTEMKIKAAHTI